MLTKALLTALAVSLPFAAAQAQTDTIKNCLEATFEIAKGAQTKQPSTAQIKELEEQIITIENFCDGQQFSEAEDARQQLAQMIERM